MPFGSKRADLLERSLQGHQSTDQEVRDLVATVRRITPLTSSACTPHPDFVSALGIRLRAEAVTLAARDIRPVPSATVPRRSGIRPLVLVMGRGVPRVLAGATASLLLVGGVVGGASRSSLPGGLLYPVKELLDSAAVQLAGSDFDRGTTLLSQAQEHIGDAGALVDRDGAKTDPASVDEALRSARDAFSGGQRALFGDFDHTGNPQALIAVQDFVARALPQLYALRPLVPADSRPGVDAVIRLLQDSRTSVARKVALCGLPCASIGGTAPAGSSSSAAPTSLPSTLATGSVPIGSVPIGGLPAPGTTAAIAVPGSTAAITVPGGIVVVPSVGGLIRSAPPPTSGGGVGVTVPSVPVPVVTLPPVPGVSVSVPLP